MFVNVVQKGFDIHANSGKRKLLTLNTPKAENEPTWQKPMLTDTFVEVNSINQNRLFLTFLSQKSQTSLISRNHTKIATAMHVMDFLSIHRRVFTL